MTPSERFSATVSIVALRMASSPSFSVSLPTIMLDSCRASALYRRLGLNDKVGRRDEPSKGQGCRGKIDEKRHGNEHATAGKREEEPVHQEHNAVGEYDNENQDDARRLLGPYP